LKNLPRKLIEKILGKIHIAGGCRAGSCGAKAEDKEGGGDRNLKLGWTSIRTNNQEP